MNRILFSYSCFGNGAAFMCNKNQDVHLSSSLPLQYFFSAEDVKNRIYPSLDAIFFFPSCFITAAWTAANSNCTFALHCLGLCCTLFSLTRVFNVDNWADRLKLQTGYCTPHDAHTSQPYPCIGWFLSHQEQATEQTLWSPACSQYLCLYLEAPPALWFRMYFAHHT